MKANKNKNKNPSLAAAAKPAASAVPCLPDGRPRKSIGTTSSLACTSARGAATSCSKAAPSLPTSRHGPRSAKRCDPTACERSRRRRQRLRSTATSVTMAWAMSSCARDPMGSPASEYSPIPWSLFHVRQNPIRQAPIRQMQWEVPSRIPSRLQKRAPRLLRNDRANSPQSPRLRQVARPSPGRCNPATLSRPSPKPSLKPSPNPKSSNPTMLRRPSPDPNQRNSTILCRSRAKASPKCPRQSQLWDRRFRSQSRLASPSQPREANRRTNSNC